MARIQQTAFSGGILSEGMYARSDTDKFAKGLRDALNVFVRPQGGVSNRAGTKPVSRFDISQGGDSPYLVPFSFGEDQTFMLEFGPDAHLRVIKDGSYLLDTGASYPLVRVTKENPAVLSLDAPATEIEEGDLVYILDPNGDCLLHEQVVRIVSMPTGRVRPIFEIVGNSTVDNTGGDWGATGPGAMIYKIYSEVQPYDPKHMPQVRFAQDADVLYMVHPEYPPLKLSRYGNLDWRFDTVMFQTTVDPIPIKMADVNRVRSDGDGVHLRLNTPHDFKEGDCFRIPSTIPGGAVTIPFGIYEVGPFVSADEFTLTDPEINGPWTGANGTWDTSGTIVSPGAQDQRGPDVENKHLRQYRYVVTAVDDNGMESPEVEPSPAQNYLGFAGSVNRIGWATVDGAERYNVYREDAGVFGLVGTTSSNYFIDENITPDTSQTPAIQRHPFNDEGDYPSAISFYEQRLVMGSTLNDPQLVEMSRVGVPENFDYSFPALDDDAVRFRLRAQEVNRINAFVPHRNFMILTSRAEWAIAPQGDGQYQRPDRRQISPLSYYGCGDKVTPLLNGEVMIYCEPSGSTVRDFQLSESDAPPGDLTVLSRDLFHGRTIVSWAFSKAPHSLVWVVLDDGTVLSMAYVPEHDIWAWTRHEFGGHDVFVEQVAVVREQGEDAVYFVVRRDLFGQPITLVERLAERHDTDLTKAHFVDSGIHYSFPTPTRYVDGLLHLRGSFITALVDGDVVERLPVDDYGTVDLGDNLGSIVSIGLPYEAILQTLDIVFTSDRDGSSEGRFKSITEVALRFEKSRGLETGYDLDRMNAVKEWSADLFNRMIPARTRLELVGVHGDWSRNATMFVRQRNPLPMTVNSITPDWEFGD